MSGNNVQKSKSPRPIAIAPAPDKSSSQLIPTSSSSSAAAIGGNELNGKRKIAPRPSDESALKPLIKIQPNNNIKKDSPPTPSNNTNNSNNNNGIRLAPAPPASLSSSQHAAATTTTSAGASGQMSYVLRPVSNQNQRMFPFFSASAAHPHLQQRLQATIDSNGNIINNQNNNNNQNHHILTENQLQLLQQHHQQRNINQQQQQLQQQQQQRPHAPVPIAPRPVATPSTSEATPSSSSATPSTSSSISTAINGSSGIKPPKIYPRPIEKKPITSQSASGTSTATPAMNITPQNIIPTPQLNPSGAYIGFAPNGTPMYLQHPGVHLQNQQLRFIQQPQGLTRMQMSHLSPMGIFPQQIIHPAALFSAAGGNATFIQSQGIPNNPQYLSISGFNPSQIPTSFMNSLNSQVSHQQQQQQLHHQQQLQQHHQQHLQQQQQQQPKLIPIAANPSTSMTTAIPSMTLASTSSSHPPTLMPRPPPLLPAGIIPAGGPPNIEANKTMKSLDATSDDDENEPPPLLDRDETVPPSVHEAFVQEAAGVRMQLPALGVEGGEPYRHVIDGFVIEESSVPFEIDGTLKDPLDYFRQIAKQQKIKKEEQEMEAAEKEEAKEKDSKKDIKKIKPKQQQQSETSESTGPKKRGRRSNKEKNEQNQNNASSSNGKSDKSKKQTRRSPSPAVSNRKRRSSSSTQREQQSRRVSPAKSVRSPPPERPGSSKGPRKSREIEQLLTMDFGPKVHIFKTASADEYTKSIKRGQQTSLRPVMQQDYKERSPEISREGDEQQCLNCRHTFAELKRRCKDHPQYCTKECRKEFRKKAKRARQQKAMEQQQQPSSSSSSNINEMAAALIGKLSPPDNGNIRKRLSNESETSASMTSSPLKLRICPSKDSESPASSSQILSPIPSVTSAAILLSSMPGPSSTPTYMNMMNISNGSNGSIPPIASPPLVAGPPPNPYQNAPDFARITEQAGLNPTDVNLWSAEDVGRWVNAITNSQTIGDIFVNEEMDGSILFMLNQNQISSDLGIKLGPTLKIVNAIRWLRNLS